MFRRDLQYGIRTLLKSPGFLSVAVLSLGLGIGANTAVFSLINAVMLRMIPVSHPEQLVLLTDPAWSGVAVETREHGTRHILSYPEFEALRAQNTVFAGMAAAQSAVSNIDAWVGRSGEERPAKIRMQLVSGEFWSVLGVQPAAGRTFGADEDRAPGANPVAVISYGFWQRQFGGAASAIGQRVRMARGVFQIIGVGPEGFGGILVGAEPDVWLPITMQQQALPGRDYLKPVDTLWLQVVARLAPAMSRQTAQAAVNVEFQQILRGWAASLPNEKQRRNMLDQKIELADGARGASELRADFADPLKLLMGMVAAVLLIACANIANLMLARATGRQREIGVRLALGAGRAQLIRQMLTESVIVSALGGALGAILAVWGTDLLLTLVANGGDIALEVHRDWRVFAFTAGLSLLTAILFGLVPAARATRLDVSRTLAASLRGAVSTRSGARTGRVLVIVQVSLSVLLATDAALLMRSLHNLTAHGLGFDRDRIVMARLDPVTAGYKGASVPAFYRQALEKLRGVPGVRSATVSNTGLFNGDSGDQVTVEGAVRHDPEDMRSRWTLTGPDYFSTMGIPLLRGREMNVADAARGAQVCVVNEAFAKFFFPGGDPIGRHVTDEYPTTRETYEIVGVAANVREHRPDERDRPRFYATLFHPIGTVAEVTLLVRARGNPEGLVSAIRRAIAEIDPNLPAAEVHTVREQLDRRLVTERLMADLSGFFSAAALLLSAVGLYGVMMYSIGRRTGEIGIRMALGASRSKVLWMVEHEALTLVAAGVAIGLPCALASGKLIGNRLFGLTASDPSMTLAAIGVIVAASMLAAYAPARRATRIDPMHALRRE